MPTTLATRPAVPAAAPPLSMPLRRCDDCQLNLGTRPGDTLRAAFACPLFGRPRHGVESLCASFVAKVAVLAVALSSCAARPPVCTPSIGDSVTELERRCGAPAAVYRAGADTPLPQEEWRYGDVYVGVIAGRVAYVLN